MSQRVLSAVSLIHSGRLVLALIVTAVLGACSHEPSPHLEGKWTGTINLADVSQRVVLRVNHDPSGRLTAAIDNLDQGTHIAGEKVALRGRHFSFAYHSDSGRGTYKATISPEGKAMTGIFRWDEFNGGRPKARRQLIGLSSAEVPLSFDQQIQAVGRLEPSRVDGDWVGVLNSKDWSTMLHVGGRLHRFALHVRTVSPGKLEVSIDFLDFVSPSSMAVSCDNAQFDGRNFSFAVVPAFASYRGTLSADGMTLSGTWSLGETVATNNGELYSEREPLRFTRERDDTGTSDPVGRRAAAAAPIKLTDLRQALDSEFTPVLAHGLLSKRVGGGVVIGVFDHGLRRIFAYGTARTDSIFEIDSVTKTFTGLALAQMVAQGQVSLDEPIRMLLPSGFVTKPEGSEITLLDLATHHAGLPLMPPTSYGVYADAANPVAHYDLEHLRRSLATTGIAKPAHTKFSYSNFGFGLLGYSLALRAGLSYEELIKTEVTEPLHLSDTVITLSSAQRNRLIQGYTSAFEPVGAYDFDTLGAGAGALRSTAGDLVTYLEANLHPDKVATDASAGSPSATLPAAFVLAHKVRADGFVNNKIALAWWFNSQAGVFFHGGGSGFGGYSSHVQFNLAEDRAIVVLYNRFDSTLGQLRFVERVAENVDELLSGNPTIPVDRMSDIDKATLADAKGAQ